MTWRRALVFACTLAGCDRLFAITHVPDPPLDAYQPDAAPPCLVNDIAVGRAHACAIIPSGDVYCWGENGYGQIQPSGPEYVLTPAKIFLPGPAAEIALGRTHTCARVGGDVYCQGQNNSGQLGKGPGDTSPALRKVDGIPPSAQIAAGGAHVCSRSATDGAVWCWGRNRHSETGGTSVLCSGNTACALPGAVPGITGAKTVVAGHTGTCIIDASDQLFCWGRNDYGQLGIGNSIGTATPTLAMVTPPVRAVDMGGKNMCAIDGMHRAFCSGEGELGTLGNGGFQATSTPVQVFTGVPVQISSASFGACAVTDDGMLSCWGRGETGDGTTGTNALPHSSMFAGITKLVSHYTASCAIVGGGALCWGSNAEGQLGRGARGITTTLEPLPLTSVTMVSQGYGHGCALGSGAVSCWGDNDYGEAGDATTLTRRLMPATVTLPITMPQHVVAAFTASCAWGAGQAACWGRNYSGQLGSGATSRALLPKRVLKPNILDGDRTVGLGMNHMCVVDDQKTVTCYGNNANGQLGNGTATNSVAGASASISNVDQVVAGSMHTCARKMGTSAGEVWCWGANNNGQLGDGSSTTRLSPVNVNGVGDVQKIAAGEDHTCVLNAGGQIYCWGKSNFGQVGYGSTTAATTPQLVITAGATDLAVGPVSSCARVNSKWQCWGRNQDGQLATGAADGAYAPTLIGAFDGADALALGDNANCKLAGGTVSCAGLLTSIGTGDNSAAIPKAPMLPGCQ
ncbi:MAG TPA: hypothetical protein VMZ53_28710 [Kofleriaceae bacterium]|nr:hypothetical protein [Kofleriaceae bacterium]